MGSRKIRPQRSILSTGSDVNTVFFPQLPLGFSQQQPEAKQKSQYTDGLCRAYRAKVTPIISTKNFCRESAHCKQNQKQPHEFAFGAERILARDEDEKCYPGGQNMIELCRVQGCMQWGQAAGVCERNGPRQGTHLSIAAAGGQAADSSNTLSQGQGRSKNIQPGQKILAFFA